LGGGATAPICPLPRGDANGCSFLIKCCLLYPRVGLLYTV